MCKWSFKREGIFTFSACSLFSHFFAHFATPKTVDNRFFKNVQLTNVCFTFYVPLVSSERFSDGIFET